MMKQSAIYDVAQGVRYHLSTKNAQFALTKISFASFLQLHSKSSKNYLDVGPASSKWLHVVEPLNGKEIKLQCGTFHLSIIHLIQR